MGKRVLKPVDGVRRRKKFGAERMGNVTRLRLGVTRMRRQVLLFHTSAAGEPQRERFWEGTVLNLKKR